MKFLVSLTVIAIISLIVYFFPSKLKNKNKKQKHHQANRTSIVVTSLVTVILLTVLAILMYRSTTAPDIWCTTTHPANSFPPAKVNTALDFFNLGNYDYDMGNCKKAIIDYTISLQKNPDYPQTYNNRAYTYMRMQDYKDALPDLDKALALNPNYIQALMNRGDIHNYYYLIDREKSIADYDKVISLGGTHGTSVCGHLFLARHNGWHFLTVLDFPGVVFGRCN